MLNIWLSLIVIAFLVYILRLVVKQVVEMKNVISWLLLCVLSLPVIWFPRVIEGASKFIGIQVPSNLVFFLGFCLLVYLHFSLTRLTSKQAVQIRQLAQKIALQDKNHEE